MVSEGAGGEGGVASLPNVHAPVGVAPQLAALQAAPGPINVHPPPLPVVDPEGAASWKGRVGDGTPQQDAAPRDSKGAASNGGAIGSQSPKQTITPQFFSSWILRWQIKGREGDGTPQQDAAHRDGEGAAAKATPAAATDESPARPPPLPIRPRH